MTAPGFAGPASPSIGAHLSNLDRFLFPAKILARIRPLPMRICSAFQISETGSLAITL